MNPPLYATRRLIRGAAVVAVLASVAACGGGMRKYPGEHETASATRTVNTPSGPAVAATSGSAGPGGPMIRNVKAAVTDPEVPAEPAPKPESLRGLSGEEIRSLMGAPAFTRSDPPAALWQYRGTGCLLDLYLYAGGNGLRVRHLEFRPDPLTREPANGQVANAVDTRACLASLLRAPERAAAP